MNCRSTFKADSRRVPGEFRRKTLQLKWGDVRFRTSGDQTAVFWEDERDVRMLTDSHDQLAEGKLMFIGPCIILVVE